MPNRMRYRPATGTTAGVTHGSSSFNTTAFISPSVRNQILALVIIRAHESKGVARPFGAVHETGRRPGGDATSTDTFREMLLRNIAGGGPSSSPAPRPRNTTPRLSPISSKGVGTLTEALAALRADPPPVTAEASAKFAKTLEKAGFPSTRPELRTGSWFSSSNAYMANCSQGLAKKMTKSEAVELASYLHPTIPKDLLHGATKPNLCAMVSDEIVTAVTTALTEAALRDTSSHARLFNIARLTNPKIPATDIAKMTLEELREVVATSLAPSDRERIVSAFGSLQDAVTHGTVGTFNLLKLAADKARAMRASHSAPVLGQAQEAAKEAVKASTAAVGTQTAAPAPSHIIGAASFAANRPRSDAARKIIATYHLDRASKFSKFLRSTAPGSAVCKPRVRTLPCGGADRRRGVALCG
eukprot:jgi/Mesvir1/13522/Mv06328-RA.1